jgi:hypothetical protein
MMATAVENTESDLSHWVPGARFFSTSDGKHMIVDADLTVYPSDRFVRRVTAVLYCNPDATVTDMVPDHIFPPGITAEEALTDLGYEVS